MLRKKLKLDDEVLQDNKTTIPLKSNQNEEATTSIYFQNNQKPSEIGLQPLIAAGMIKSAENLNKLLKPLKYLNPVVYCYNPLEYALTAYSDYIHKYCNTTKDIIFVGMNPGPFGMCQTGIPFGEINAVKDWLRIRGEIGKPDVVCSNRPILGFSCTRSEDSGKKFWGLFQDICETPEEFFKSGFVYNYCPIAFMNKSGTNITPDKLKGDVKQQLEGYCNETLTDVINLLKPKYIIGVGKYAFGKCQNAAKATELNAQVIYMIHPSPIIPNNQNWAEKAKNLLIEYNLLQLFQKA